MEFEKEATSEPAVPHAATIDNNNTLSVAATGIRSNSGSRSPTFLKLKGQNLVYAVTVGSSVGFLLLGYDLGYMGGLTTSDEFL
ncbi:hypothetical protein V1511DRAFT_201449, partial [Dipodascopsis uninucleata]